VEKLGSKNIIFDFGGTLADYEGLPKAWCDYYEEAFHAVANNLNVAFSKDSITRAIEILTRYNARVNPREYEISDETIFQEICEVLGLKESPKKEAKNFYSYFQKKLVVYEETCKVLCELKERGCRIGVISDLPTAMPHETFLEDIGKIGFDFDVLLSSQTIGWRKPCIQGLEMISKDFGCSLSDLVYVGDEKKDMDMINKAGGISVLINRRNKEIDYNQKIQIKNLNELLKYL